MNLMCFLQNYSSLSVFSELFFFLATSIKTNRIATITAEKGVMPNNERRTPARVVIIREIAEESFRLLRRPYIKGMSPHKKPTKSPSNIFSVNSTKIPPGTLQLNKLSQLFINIINPKVHVVKFFM